MEILHCLGFKQPPSSPKSTKPVSQLNHPPLIFFYCSSFLPLEIRILIFSSLHLSKNSYTNYSPTLVFFSFQEWLSDSLLTLFVSQLFLPKTLGKISFHHLLYSLKLPPLRKNFLNSPSLKRISLCSSLFSLKLCFLSLLLKNVC